MVAKKDENHDLTKLIAALTKLTKELGDAVGLPFFNLSKTPDKLYTGEEKRAKQIAGIFKDVFAKELEIKIGKDTSKSTKGKTASDDVPNILNQILNILKANKDKTTKSDTKSGLTKLFAENKGITGILAFGVGIYFIINSLLKASNIDLGGAVKAVLAVGAFTKIFLMLSEKKESIAKSAAAFALFGSTFNFIIIPFFKKISALPFNEIIASLLKFGLIFFGLNKLIETMNKSIDLNQVAKISLAYTLFGVVFGSIILPIFDKLVNLNMGSILASLLKLSLIFVVLNKLISTITKSINTTQLMQISISFGLFGLTFGLLILPTLNNLNKVPYDELLISLGKFATVFFAISGLILLVEKSVNTSQLKEISIAFGLFGLAVGLIILPTLYLIDKVPYDRLLKSLVKFGTVFIGISFLSMLVEKSINMKELKEMSIAFALFGLTIGLVILPTLYLIDKVPYDRLLKSLVKFGTVFGTLGLLIFVMHRALDAKKVKDISISYALFGLVMGLIILPTLNLMAKAEYGMILDGLFKMGLVMSGLSILILLIGKVANVAKKVLIGLATFTILSFVLSYLFDVINKFTANINWGNIAKNIGWASVAIVAFGALLTGIGFLLTGPLGLFIAVGAVAVMGLSLVLDNMVKMVTNFANKDWKSISLGIKNGGLAITGLMWLVSKLSLLAISSAMTVALGFIPVKMMLSLIDSVLDTLDRIGKIKVEPTKLIQLGEALPILGNGISNFAKLLTSGFSNIVLDKVASFFGVDVFSKIEKYLSLDGEKLKSVGMGFNYLADGLKNFASVKLNSDVIASDITKLVKPILEFSTSLSRFSSAYSMLDKVLSSSDFAAKVQLNMKSDNDYQASILELHERELNLQQAQLDQLQLNGMKLDDIATRISMLSVAGNRTSPIIAGNNQSKVTMKSQNFSTKDDYMNNMKLMTGMLQP